jgi:hypothetical protein
MIRRIILLVIVISSVAYSQPYYYYYQYNSSYDVPGYSGDIYRLNLTTNGNELFASNVGRVNGPIFYNSDQSIIFFQVRFSLVLIDVSDPSRQETEILSGINEIHGVKDFPGTNRYFVTFDDDQDSTKTVIMDRSTMQPLDTIGESYQYNPFFSKDYSYIYQFQPDSTGIFFSKVIISNKESELPRRCGTIVPVESFVILSDARNGLALMSYEDNTKNDFSGVEYVLCDVDRNITYAPFNFPWRSEGYLSSDGKYAIIEQVNFDTTRIGGEYHTGNVYVFNASTGELNQRLSLPPGGKVLVFDDYPQTFYYYNDSTNQSVAISDTVVTPTGVLIDTLISLKHQAVANGWLREGMGHSRDINEMMRGRGWYSKGEFGKFRNWEPDENWDFDHDWNNGIVKVLDKRLDMAKRELTRGDSVGARRDLEIFVMEVEMLNNLSIKLEERHQTPIITNDGYLLLKMNAEYLIDRLPERHGRGDEGEGRGKK